MSRIITIVLVVWLVIGAIAAGQRGYYSSHHKTNCSQVGDTVLTIIAGPLNYVGVNPKVSCSTPQPSK
jgi:hypothetical protein